MSRFPIYALSNVGLPPLLVWQQAIDDLDLLFAVELLSVEIAERPCAMRFEHLSTRFSCASAAPESLLAHRHGAWPGSYMHAYGFDDYGRHIESTAAQIACLSCVLATGGALFRVGGEPEQEVRWARRDLDFELAYDLRREDAYFERYPDQRTLESSGPMELEIILHRGSPVERGR